MIGCLKLRQDLQWKKAKATEKDKSYIYESPINGKVLFRRVSARKTKLLFIQYVKDEHVAIISKEALNKINKPSVERTW